MQINVGIMNLEESNEFLKWLWANMNKEFDSFKFQYTPSKVSQENRIEFGFVTIEDVVLEVSISYKTKGSINNVYFNVPEQKNEPTSEKVAELNKRLHSIVEYCKKNIPVHEDFHFQTPLYSEHPLMSYKGENFSIQAKGHKESTVSFTVKAYDYNQALIKFTDKVNNLMDFLSLETNATYKKGKVEVLTAEIVIKPQKEVYYEEMFIDTFALKEDHLVVSKEGKEFINKITDPSLELDNDMKIFLKACSHFHTARCIEQQMYDDKGEYIVDAAFDGNKTELATTMYVSALEVVTLIGFTEDKCDCCGQSKFQISKRIKELASENFPSKMAREFIQYYDKRSKYLHTGMKLMTEIPSSQLVPVLNPIESSGCEFPFKIYLPHVVPYINVCLRRFYQHKFLK